jgi:putative ATPase
LPHVENGLIILYGATTEHPSSLNGALASRCRIEVLHPLDDQALHKLLQRALDHPKGCRGPYGELVHVSPEACEYLVKASARDGRQLLSLLEAALSASDGPEVSLQVVQLACTNPVSTRSDRGDLVSALIKSVRGSNPSASLYWMAQLESRGEDPLYLARRLLIQASEDIGLARPGALALAQSGYEAVRVLGPPEAWIVIAETVCYLAQCPKSWASTQGLQNAREAVSQHPHPTVPPHLRSHSLSGYRHPSEGDGSQVYLPKELEGLTLLPKS